MMRCIIKDIVQMWYEKESQPEINRLLEAGYWLSEPFPLRNADFAGLGVCLTLYENIEEDVLLSKVKKVH